MKPPWRRLPLILLALLGVGLAGWYLSPGSVPIDPEMPAEATVEEPSADELIKSMVKDPPTKARQALVRLRLKPLTAADRRALLMGIPSVPEDLADDLYRWLIEEASRAELRPLLRDSEGKLRLMAARTLAQRTGSEGAREDLIHLARDPDPRLRALALRARREAAKAGDPVAVQELAQHLTEEPDPRVRQAAENDQPMPHFGEDEPDAVALPPAATQARPAVLEALWNSDSIPGGAPFSTRSTITVDAEGRATVETVAPNGWHIRYGGMAWRDAKGNLVIDARLQPIEYLQRPAHGSWIPDSLVITPDGTTRTIDDHQQAGDGGTGMPGHG